MWIGLLHAAVTKCSEYDSSPRCICEHDTLRMEYKLCA